MVSQHYSSYLGWQIQRVWWPRRESFDNVAVHEDVTVRDFIVIQKINNEFGSDLVPIHLQRWIDSMRIQCASPKTGIKCEHDECAFDAHLIPFLGLVVKRPLDEASYDQSTDMLIPRWCWSKLHGPWHTGYITMHT